MGKIYQKVSSDPYTNWGSELCDCVITEQNDFFAATYRSHFNLYFLVFLRQLKLKEGSKPEIAKIASDFYDFLEKAEIGHGYQAVCDLFEANSQMDLFNDSSLFIDSKKAREVQWTINKEKQVIVQTARMILSDLKKFVQKN